MHVTIARQPIFTCQKRLYAYELLFRDALGTPLQNIDGDRATASLLSSTFLTEGIEKIAGNKPSFINFTERLLLKRLPENFPKTKLVVEILEHVEPTKEIITVVEELKDEGYTIALDDFVYQKKFEPLIALADIIKVDFRISSPDEIERMLHRLSHYKIKFLAEKVESYEEFERAAKLGFIYFQGFFFSKPQSIRIKEISSTKTSMVRLLAEVNMRSTTVERLEEIVNHDVGISYKLLRYINSAYFYLLNEVESIRQAIVYLGEQGIKQFITLVIISELASDKPKELIRTSVIRAKFCEELAHKSSRNLSADHAFLLGLFSLIDAVLDTDMESVLAKLPLSNDIKASLLRQQGPLAPLLQAVLSYEKRDAQNCLPCIKELGIDPKDVYPAYKNAVAFSDILTAA